ncbi:MAG: ribosome maturation factor RimM [Rhodospirillaceae bacterium]
MDRTSRVCLGVIVGAKGLKGEVRIKSFTEDPADVGAYGPVTTGDGRKFNVTVGGGKEGVVIAKLAGVADRTQAEALKGVELFVERTALPAPKEGEFYHADLIGAVVKLTSGEMLGTVSGLHNFGGGDMMEVGEGRASVLIPLTSEAIAALDVKAGQVVVHPLPGLLGGESDPDDESGGETDVTDG